ncbi:MAG TPA: HAMP domain-containing sensor histidine kinase [Pseudonocardiaceae bacterium]|jgi:signal transduction histidine kinase
MSIVAVAALAVLGFAIPLAVAVRNMDYSQAVTALQRDATRITAVVPDSITPKAGAVPLPRGLPADLTVGIYTTSGRLIDYHGPTSSALAAAAADGQVHTGIEGTELAVSAPVPSDQTVAATVRVSIADDQVTDGTLGTWAIMALLGLGVIGIAWLLARRQGRRIAAPLEQLTISARALGDGDFTIRPGRSQITEADALAEAIEATAGRLGWILRRERAFSTQVSHQLRTPLTALLLGLESALSRPDADLRQAMATALRRGEQLHVTIEELLQLARENPARDTAPLVVGDLLDAVREHWQTAFADAGRTLRVSYPPDLPMAHGSVTAIRHVVEVLVDNALVHGAGVATVRAQAVAEGLVVEVSDEGLGLADPELAFAPRSAEPDPGARGNTHGIGLALARSLAEAEGGRLVLRHASPHPVFVLLLPEAGRQADEP